MAIVKFETGNTEPDAFNLYDDTHKIGEMIVEVKENEMIVYHAEVEEEQTRKGYAGLLLITMVDYIWTHKLVVVPLCPYVHAQFKRHPDLYDDVWKRDQEEFPCHSEE